MGGQEKKIDFSDFGLYVHRQFKKSVCGKNFVYSPTSKFYCPSLWRVIHIFS